MLLLFCLMRVPTFSPPIPVGYGAAGGEGHQQCLRSAESRRGYAEGSRMHRHRNPLTRLILSIA